jgi:hypothetical protein
LTWRASLRLHNELNHARSDMRRMASRSSGPGSLRSAEAPVPQKFVLRAELRRFRADLIWWMFLSCASTLLGTLILLIALR